MEKSQKYRKKLATNEEKLNLYRAKAKERAKQSRAKAKIWVGTNTKLLEQRRVFLKEKQKKYRIQLKKKVAVQSEQIVNAVTVKNASKSAYITKQALGKAVTRVIKQLPEKQYRKEAVIKALVKKYLPDYSLH